jgi:site-specific recombinase XerD
LKDFGFHLQKQGLSHLTVNHVLSLGFTAFNFWHKEGLIPANPAQGIGKFAGQEKKRGVLTEAEAKTLFERDWKDRAAYAGNLTAAVCGLRVGEILQSARMTSERKRLTFPILGMSGTV